MATLYAHCAFPVRADLRAAHAHTLASLSEAGTWFDGAERAALADTVRRARHAAGLQRAAAPTDGAGQADPVAARVVEQVAVQPRLIERELFDQACAEGLRPEAYVESVGIAARLSAVDTFAHGLGMAPAALAQVSRGNPRRMRPKSAVDEGAWLPTIPNGEAGGEIGAELYGGQFAANILRALSLVPEEARDVIALGNVQYVSVNDFMDFSFSHDTAIDRSQVELVAARISALNDCFY